MRAKFRYSSGQNFPHLAAPCRRRPKHLRPTHDLDPFSHFCITQLMTSDGNSGIPNLGRFLDPGTGKWCQDSRLTHDATDASTTIGCTLRGRAFLSYHKVLMSETRKITTVFKTVTETGADCRSGRSFDQCQLRKSGKQQFQNKVLVQESRMHNTYGLAVHCHY